MRLPLIVPADAISLASDKGQYVNLTGNVHGISSLPLHDNWYGRSGREC